MYTGRGCGLAEAWAIRTGEVVVDHVEVDGRAVAKEDAQDEVGGCCPPLTPPAVPFPENDMVAGRRRLAGGWRIPV